MTENAHEKPVKDAIHAMNLDYYTERLADLTLLDRALKVPSPGGGITLAVPCGGTRRAGFCQIDPVQGARWLVHMLDHPDDFPNPRWDGLYDTVSWGEEIDFGAHDDYVEHEVATGRMYGYSEDAINKHLLRIAARHLASKTQKTVICDTPPGALSERDSLAVETLESMISEGLISGPATYKVAEDEVSFTWEDGTEFEYTCAEFDAFMTGFTAREVPDDEPDDEPESAILRGIFEIKCLLNRNSHHPAATEPRVIAEVDGIWFMLLQNLQTWGAITEWHIDTENDTVIFTMMGRETTLYPWTIGNEVSGIVDGWLAARAQFADHTGATQLHPNEREFIKRF